MALYPKLNLKAVVESIHGIEIEDAYRELEDFESPVTKDWLHQQSNLTKTYYENIDRDTFKNRVEQLLGMERIGVPFQRGHKFFYFANRGLKNHSVLYKLDSIEGSHSPLIDPNEFSENGLTSLTGIRLSKDASLIAYGKAQSGSDQQTWHLREVESGKDLEDELHGIYRPFVSWTHDHKGFYYTRRYRESEDKFSPMAGEKVYYHRIGDDQSRDQLVFENAEFINWGYVAKVSEDGKYLLVFAYESANDSNRIFIRKLGENGSDFKSLTEEFSGYFVLVASEGKDLYFRTDLDAPKGRVVKMNAENGSMTEVIPEHDEILRIVSVLDNKLVTQFLKDAHSKIRVYSLEGKELYDVALPGPGTVNGFQGLRIHEKTFYSFTNYTTPYSQYIFDFKTQKDKPFHRPKVSFNPDDFVTKQVFYKSRDGTKVPMFVSHHKSLRNNGKNPTFLYGYGGFGYSHTPSFISANLAWMEQGGIYAVANIRGGGEYGEEWHQAGKGVNKINSFHDFVAAAEFLVDSKLTCREKLGIGGRSNGGLTVAACVNMRPELFRAAVVSVGVTDLVRFKKHTVGSAWCDEYGDPDIPEDIKFLYKYSPLHQIKKDTEYPAILISTGDHDDRVHPSHSFKYAAALQHAQKDASRPIVLRIEENSGHGQGKPTEKYIEEIVDQYSFLADQLGLFK